MARRVRVHNCGIGALMPVPCSNVLQVDANSLGMCVDEEALHLHGASDRTQVLCPRIR